ncbi:MAG: class I SAM-dependent methyltransferase [Vicinamibacterales bacterium]
MASPDWNERFSGPGYAYGTEPNEFLVEVATRLPAGPVLSLGEGEGRNGVYLAQLGHDVLAVDGSEMGLQKVRALASARGVEIRTEQARLEDYQIAPAQWAVILCFFVHMEASVREAVFRAAVDGLQPGGMFVLEAFGPGQLAHGTGGPKEATRLASLSQLQRELDGLEWVIAREGDRMLAEGIYHSGLSSTVQLLGRRSPT